MNSPNPLVLHHYSDLDHDQGMVEELVGGTVGERIRGAYMRAGMNRSQFARLLDVAYTTVNDWEKKDRTPQANTLERIAEILHVSIDELMGTTDQAPHTQAVLSEFLASPQAEGISDGERRTLESMRFYDMSPDLAMYAGVLSMLRVFGTR